jgi:hypothetical protein
MNVSNDGITGSEDGATSNARPSARVRLEVAFLDADADAPAPGPSTHDERPCLTVLVVAAEADVRRYVRECLRERADVRVIEAGTAAAAVALAESYPPDLVIVDGLPSAVLSAPHAASRAIVIVDDLPSDTSTPAANVRLLTRPFTAEGLLAEVRQLLG